MGFAMTESLPFNARKCIEGTLRRIDYHRRELSIIAEGQIWDFQVDPDCQFWFEGQPVILRCFHPLDHVRVDFQSGQPVNHVKGISGWERPTQAN